MLLLMRTTCLFGFFWFFFLSLSFVLFECVNIFVRNVTERMSREKEIAFLIILLCNLYVCLFVLLATVDF